jgi:pimeloyl-ACP methyl ester carboxylesterase
MDRLREIKIPTLILVGEREIQYFRIVAEALAYGITGAKKAVVSNSGHLAHYAEPERFTAEVLRFLSEVVVSAEVQP